MDTLDRLRQLERRVLWMRRVLTGCVAALLLLFLSGQSDSTPAQIRAQSFVVVNADGKALAELSSDEHGYGQLRLKDVEGKARLVVAYRWVNQTFHQPSVLLFDRGGKLRGHLGLSIGESAGLWFHGKDQEHRVSLAGDMPVLWLRDGHSMFSVRGGAKGQTFRAGIWRGEEQVWKAPKE